MIEIERKFLVNDTSFLEDYSRSNRIVQGYLSSHPERTVRVRIKGDRGFLTIKGKSEGFSRYEWEHEINIEEAEKLLQLCEKGVIDKIRYDVIVGIHVYEVDVFYGENEGLIIAEIELDNENESFEKPNWLGNEVTEDIKYYNSYLSKHPFKTW